MNFRNFIHFLLVLIATASRAQAERTFHIKLGQTATADSYSGRVYVFFSKNKEPRREFRFVKSAPIIAVDVNEWEPGETVELTINGDDVLQFPRNLTDADVNGYSAQALVRLNGLNPELGAGEGNAFSPVVTLADFTSEPKDIELSVDTVQKKYSIPRPEGRKAFAVTSNMLGAFHGREVTFNADLLLPDTYDEQPDMRYPVVFHVPAFGGSYLFAKPMVKGNDRGVDFIHVMLDASCPNGHHGFADSQNNGPWASAFVHEFIPALDKKFRTIPTESGRFLTGVSSGGWSSLWLQINFPDVFAGTWSHAPDPVDFRDFQNINIYEAKSVYRARDGNRRPLAQNETSVLIWFDELAALEEVLGYGGQLGSFEAVFSPKDADGTPKRLFDRSTGQIDPRVAQHWKRFDIQRVLRTGGNSLISSLQGKLHVHIDKRESFFLTGAVELLRKSLDDLNSDATVIIHPTFGHANFMTEEFVKGMNNEMADAYLAENPR